MTRLLLGWLLAGIFVASLGLNVLHWSGEWRASDPPVQPVPRCIDLERLELTPDQEAAVTRCGRSFGEEDIELRKTLALRTAELESALAREELDEAGLRSLADEVSDLRSQLLKKRVESVIEVRTILSPCQMRQLRRCCESCPQAETPLEVE